MDPSEEQRAQLAAKIISERLATFGDKKAAYSAAKVNSATWDKAESEQRVRPDLLARIVRTLWPETRGDWRAAVGVEGQDAEYVAAPGERVESDVTNEQIMRRLDEMARDIEALKRQQGS